MESFLILEDGSIWRGRHIGFQKEIISEIVFNTSMTGYQEVLTDPSYAGQAVVMTYPLIGNYGVCSEDLESAKIWADGCIVREISRMSTNFRHEEKMEDFLIRNEIPCIERIDTRALTKKLREKGTMNGMITTKMPEDKNFVLNKIRDYKIKDAVKKVTCTDKRKIKPEKEGNGLHVALLDLGTKKSILHQLVKRGCAVTVYPALTKAEEILLDNPDGIMLTNGPGDPKDCGEIIAQVKKMYESRVPVFAICLGHQLMALANGGDTCKMKYGHRGANHPVKDLESERVYISSQNHGYVVIDGSVPAAVAETNFRNVNDGTVEGLHYLGKNVFTVQFHPEASAGPGDSSFLFDTFIHMMEVAKNA